MGRASRSCAHIFSFDRAIDINIEIVSYLGEFFSRLLVYTWSDFTFDLGESVIPRNQFGVFERVSWLSIVDGEVLIIDAFFLSNLGLAFDQTESWSVGIFSHTPSRLTAGSAVTKVTVLACSLCKTLRIFFVVLMSFSDVMWIEVSRTRVDIFTT